MTPKTIVERGIGDHAEFSSPDFSGMPFQALFFIAVVNGLRSKTITYWIDPALDAPSPTLRMVADGLPGGEEITFEKPITVDFHNRRLL